MKCLYLQDQKERLAFVEKAAEAFSKDSGMRTYTEGPVEKGCLFAVRWGLGGDCILLLELDPDNEPEIYGQVIQKEGGSHEHDHSS